MCKMVHFGNCDPETADQEYYIFHKPNKNDKEAREFWEEFFERFKPKIEEREIYGRKQKVLIFEEPIDARGFVFPDVPSRPIKITTNGITWEFCDREQNSKCIDFRGAVFKEEVRFNNAMFNKISFEFASFEKEAHFRDIIMGFEDNKPVFRKTHFKGMAYFNNATLKNVWFQLAVFSGVAEFDGATLTDVSFDSATFKGRVSFEGTTFKGTAGFSNAVFESVAWFWSSRDKETSFNGPAIFERVHFGDKAQFNGVVFRDIVVFDESEFREKSSFKNSTFLKVSRFCKVNFWRDIDFSGVIFGDNADFASSIFSQSSSFTNTLFYRNANFIGCTLKGETLFVSAHFVGDAIFDKVYSGRILDFTGRMFGGYNLGPKFESNLSFSDSQFYSIKFVDVLKKVSTIDTEEFLSLFKRCNSIIEAARVQRLSFEHEGKRDEADEMFVLEMRFKRKLRLLTSPGMITKFKNFFEWLLADLPSKYGTKLERIGYGIVGIVFLFGLAYTFSSKNPLLGVSYTLAIFSVLIATGVTHIYDKNRQSLKKSVIEFLGVSVLLYLLSLYLVIIEFASYFTEAAIMQSVLQDGVPREIPVNFWSFRGFFNALYYSLVTFTTLGYGDMHPTGWLKALSAIEALTGAVFMALIVAVIARKWMR